MVMPGNTVWKTQMERAALRGRELKAMVPRATAVRYEHGKKRIIITLDSRLEIGFDPRDAEGLQNAQSRDLEKIEITPSGLGIHFPRLDADIYLPALLEGFLGSKRWMAARLGAAGGRKRSEAKSAAAKRNGMLGGRPLKAPPVLRKKQRAA